MPARSPRRLRRADSIAGDGNFAAGEVTETQTQNHNIATVRIYDAVGARYVRGDYTFHAWLGDE